MNTVEPWYNKGPRDWPRICSLQRSFDKSGFLCISLQLGAKIVFVVLRFSLYRSSLNRSFTLFAVVFCHNWFRDFRSANSTGTSYNCQWHQECLGSNSIIINWNSNTDNLSHPVSSLSCFRVFVLTKHLLCDYIGPWAGKMNRISRCDWLPERARWSCLARSGNRLCPARTKLSFCVFMDRSINTQKKELGNIHPSWPHAWFIITSSKILTGTQKGYQGEDSFGFFLLFFLLLLFRCFI